MFPTKPKEIISKSYNCHTYVPRDSTLTDSTVIDEEGVIEDLPLEETATPPPPPANVTK